MITHIIYILHFTLLVWACTPRLSCDWLNDDYCFFIYSFTPVLVLLLQITTIEWTESLSIVSSF